MAYQGQSYCVAHNNAGIDNMPRLNILSGNSFGPNTQSAHNDAGIDNRPNAKVEHAVWQVL